MKLFPDKVALPGLAQAVRDRVLSFDKPPRRVAVYALEPIDTAAFLARFGDPGRLHKRQYEVPGLMARYVADEHGLVELHVGLNRAFGAELVSSLETMKGETAVAVPPYQIAGMALALLDQCGV